MAAILGAHTLTIHAISSSPVIGTLLIFSGKLLVLHLAHHWTHANHSTHVVRSSFLVTACQVPVWGSDESKYRRWPSNPTQAEEAYVHPISGVGGNAGVGTVHRPDT